MRSFLNPFLAVAFLSLAAAAPTTSNYFRGTNSYGGTGGNPFDDSLDSRMPKNPKLVSITLRGGNRVDAIDFKVNDQTFSHGGSGGESQTLGIQKGEHIQTVEMCWPRWNVKWPAKYTRRLHWIKVTKNNGEYIQVGKRSGERKCATVTAPSGYGLLAGSDYSSRPARFYLNATLKKDDGSETETSIDLNQCIANVNGEFKYQPMSEVHPSSPQAPEPINMNTILSNSKPQHTHPSPEPTNIFELSSSQAKGAITTLPPHNPLCIAFATMFTEPNGRQLCFIACPIVAVPAFSAEVALGYGEICEAAGVRSFGGSVSNTKISLSLDNGVRIMGDVASGGPETEVAIAGSGHWAVSR